VEGIGVPDGFEWGTHHQTFIFFSLVSVVYFGWNPDLCSSKLDLIKQEPTAEYYRETLTGFKVRDGSGFKSVMGDIALPAGGKYFFLFKIV